MSDTYTKLFSSITESTVWGEPYSTRIAWVTMLAMADARGCVFGSVPGLARRANITREEADQALASFYAPDLDSRTKDHDGRRVEPIDGGWRLINHSKYAQIRNAEERREYMREFMRKKRAEEHKEQHPGELAPVNTVSTSLAELAEFAPLALALTPTLERARAKATVQQAAHADRFADFWSAYPLKKAKAAARKAWAKVDPAVVDLILEILPQQAARDDDWLRGFVPHPATYLNGSRWLDEIAKPKPTGQDHAPRKLSAIERVEQAIRERRDAENRRALESGHDGQALAAHDGSVRDFVVEPAWPSA